LKDAAPSPGPQPHRLPDHYHAIELGRLCRKGFKIFGVPYLYSRPTGQRSVGGDHNRILGVEGGYATGVSRLGRLVARLNNILTRLSCILVGSLLSPSWQCQSDRQQR
jgi:hypothetical protein